MKKVLGLCLGAHKPCLAVMFVTLLVGSAVAMPVGKFRCCSIGTRACLSGRTPAPFQLKRVSPAMDVFAAAVYWPYDSA